MTHINDFKAAAVKTGMIPDEETHEVSEYDPEEESPLAGSFAPIADIILSQKLKSGYRKWSGMNLMPTPDYFELVRPDAVREIFAFSMESYCLGILAAKKAVEENDMNKWLDTGARTDAVEMANRMCDEDGNLSEVFSDYAAQSVRAMAERAHFDLLPEVACYKVWDFFQIVGRGMALQMFVCGYEVGRKEKLDEAFTSIVDQILGKQDE